MAKVAARVRIRRTKVSFINAVLYEWNKIWDKIPPDGYLDLDRIYKLVKDGNKNKQQKQTFQLQTGLRFQGLCITFIIRDERAE